MISYCEITISELCASLSFKTLPLISPKVGMSQILKKARIILSEVILASQLSSTSQF